MDENGEEINPTASDALEGMEGGMGVAASSYGNEDMQGSIWIIVVASFKSIHESISLSLWLELVNFWF